MIKEEKEPPNVASDNEPTQVAKLDPVCKPCVACRSDISLRAVVCPHCQKSQKHWIRLLNAASGPTSLFVAIVALTATLIGNYISSIDKYFSYYFLENPPLLGGAIWKPDISAFPLDKYGQSEVNLAALEIEAKVYNDGFSPTLIVGYECRSTQEYFAKVVSQSGDEVSDKAVGPFTVNSTLSFVQDQTLIVAQGTSEKILFRPAHLHVELVDEADFSSLKGQEFLLTGGGPPNCRILHWYEDRLWGLPKDLHYSSDTLNTSSAYLFFSLMTARVSDEIEKRVASE